MTTDPTPDRPTDARPLPRAEKPREAAIASESLLKGRNTVTIEHKGVSYRLQETRAGKLILTK
ncbi:hemin uptake protein HemP [Denitromonas sp.]|uniref:hemin uptake protein HemP n=1 Tax=Denitromonas sp. TaxID=2734609 RepID=UPI003A876957